MAAERWQYVYQGRPVLASHASRHAGLSTPLAKPKPYSTAGIPTVGLFLSDASTTLRKEQSCRRST